MKQRRVRFTATAQRHVRREKLWWVENRIHTEVSATEFEEALRILAVLPGAGTAYPQADAVDGVAVDGIRCRPFRPLPTRFSTPPPISVPVGRSARRARV